MVDTVVVNGEHADTATAPVYELPEMIELAAAEARRIPSPGTQRALRAETGKGFDEMCGPAADGADRIQTLIWMKLRRQYPGLRWVDCADVDVQIEEGALDVDPTRLVASESSPPSADSGG
jgi:hypothetical protein